MSAWQCVVCGRLSIRFTTDDGVEVRGFVGHAPDVCRACSTEMAKQVLPFTPDSVQWLVESLRAELAAERRDRAEDARYDGQAARDARNSR